MATKVPYGDSTQMGLYLRTGVAPTGGAVFTLSIKSGETARITFPPTVTIPAGQQDASFEVTWSSEGTTILQSQLTEWGGVATTGTVYDHDIECLGPPSSEFIALASEDFDVLVGGTVNLLAVFSFPVASDQVVNLNSSDPSIATVPTSVTVLTGERTASVPVTGVAEGSVVITATHPSATKQANGDVVTGGAGLPTGHYRPSAYWANQLRPQPLSAEEE